MAAEAYLELYIFRSLIKCISKNLWSSHIVDFAYPGCV